MNLAGNPNGRATLQGEGNARLVNRAGGVSTENADARAESYRSDGKLKACGNCGRHFTPIRSSGRFCSESCRKRAWDKKAMLKSLRAVFNEWIDKLEAGL